MKLIRRYCRKPTLPHTGIHYRKRLQKYVVRLEGLSKTERMNEVEHRLVCTLSALLAVHHQLVFVYGVIPYDMLQLLVVVRARAEICDDILIKSDPAVPATAVAICRAVNCNAPAQRRRKSTFYQTSQFGPAHVTPNA